MIPPVVLYPEIKQWPHPYQLVLCNWSFPSYCAKISPIELLAWWAAVSLFVQRPILVAALLPCHTAILLSAFWASCLQSHYWLLWLQQYLTVEGVVSNERILLDCNFWIGLTLLSSVGVFLQSRVAKCRSFLSLLAFLINLFAILTAASTSPLLWLW